MARRAHALTQASRCCFVAGLALTPWLIAQVNTFFALGFLLWLAGGRNGLSLRELGREPLVRVFVAGFALLTVAAIASPMSAGESFAALLRYRELLLAVPIVALFRDPAWRDRALLAFAVSGLALATVSSAQWLGLLASPRGPAEAALVLRHGITHSTVLATLALVAWLQAARPTANMPSAFWRIVSLACAANALLMVPGRTGYLILSAGLAYAGFRRFGWRGLLAALLAAAVLGSAAYRASDVFRHRIDAAVAETLRFADGEVAPTSAGSRLLFWESSIELIARQPLFGTGLGSWHDRAAEVMTPEQRERMLMGHEHPHNELLHVATQTGALGVALFLVGLLSIARYAARMRGDADLLAVTLVAYAAGSLVNAFLWDSVEGQLFAALAALAAARIGADSDTTR
ncbi:O-antigen ligase family protein [Burkholderiaceae bacterium FT117]|uniref:O-antigen ligase family protein n=1 Tax=Zeimonas sediminis TaxID=2944268 RepID=UPI002342F78F|nr:O-antigen ligase family protein [Zeimonas sediminis]MCM5570378.1 O-antigen ligase family protein [Zeimonas sediminis]